MSALDQKSREATLAFGRGVGAHELPPGQASEDPLSSHPSYSISYKTKTCSRGTPPLCLPLWLLSSVFISVSTPKGLTEHLLWTKCLSGNVDKMDLGSVLKELRVWWRRHLQIADHQTFRLFFLSKHSSPSESLFQNRRKRWGGEVCQCKRTPGLKRLWKTSPGFPFAWSQQVIPICHF